MGNEQASRVVQAPGIETNQDELARPPIMRYSIGDEDTELFSEHRTPGGAVRNVVTEAPRSASFQILPLKQAEVFRTPEECHIHCIASHCVKCRTFLFETGNNKDLRSTISPERLDGLALLAIENEAAKQHNTYDLLGTAALQTIKPDSVD